jgi:RHS repeat-associated protein
MNLVDRANRQRSLAAMSRTLRSGRIAANASVPTTTYAYDANGNVTQAGGWSYVWDYLNHMLAAGFGNSTTTYAYDAFGSRVMQTSTTSTTFYPNKYFSMASAIVGSTTYATSTNYIWNGDTLLATIDQKLINGTATGSPITRFIHPDHLGSTNAVTDQSGNLVQLLDYFPYGATRVSTSSYPTNEKRQYIDQFSDAQTGLSYLMSRYYNPAQGQFLSEDPVFLGEPKQQNLQDPQSLNVYSYSTDNPITKKDPSGRQFVDTALDVASDYAPSVGSTISSAGSWISSAALGTAAAIIYNTSSYNDAAQKAQNYNNNRGGSYRYIPFSQQGRLVQPPGTPDPFDPWDGWKPDGSWKGWIGTGIGIIGAATDIYQQAKDLPSNRPPLPSSGGTWTALPPIVIQGGSTYYRNYSGLLSSTPQIATSRGGGSAGGLPASVSQGGVTYYRNSSGLLSASPGH